MDSRHLYQPNWDKVLAVLNGELPETTVLTTDELLLLDELKAIKASSRMYSDIEFDAESKISVIKQRLNFQEEIQGKPKKLWPKVLIAAAVAAIITTAGILLFDTSRPDINSGDVLVNDIKPGTNGATITLANGKVIQLSGNKKGVIVGSDLKYNDGTPLSPQGGDAPLGGERDHSIQTLTATTAKGQTYQFQLPDGTEVWLNAESKIIFPSQFSGADRKVVITGEGYFEVAKDKAHPFVVTTDQQEVKVLGTHFNINSYADEPSTKTTLLEGSIKLSPLSPGGGTLAMGERSIILAPGELGTLNSTGKITVASVDPDQAIAWRNGKFVFEREEIESVMRMLSRWYNVEVVYQGNVKDMTFSGSISRYDNISKILNKITFTETIHFKIEGRRVYVMP